MASPASLTDLLEFELGDAIGRSGGYGKVSVLAKLTGNERLPPGARIVSRFGEIAAVDIPRRALSRFARSPGVESVELPRPLHANHTAITHRTLPNKSYTEHGESLPTGSSRRPPGVKATGKGSVVAVLDWGIDFASPGLVIEEGGRKRTRLLGIFDQRGPDTSSNRWGYGRIITQEEINAALQEEDPYTALGYHPAEADSRDPRTGRWQGSHGTHVIDIAAGNGRGGGPVGVAPEADLLFCHLSRSRPLIGPGTLGDNTNIIHAMDWCFEMAGTRPIVINASLGAHNGAHDGTALTEIAIDRALEEAPGRAMVNSAGNYYRKAAHASGTVARAGSETLRLFVPPNDPTPSELELWHAPTDRFTISLRPPGASRPVTARLGDRREVRVDGEVVGRLTYGHRNNGDIALWFLFSRAAPAGVWSLTLTAEDVSDGRFHAWIERDSGLQPRFIGETVDPNYTTGSICNGFRNITVGAIDGRGGAAGVGQFSSSGPTRDGRIKPELVAPGVRVVAARSAPPGGRPAGRLVAKSGTSMAAPHVAGTIALMHEAAGRPLSVDQVRRLLFSTLTQPPLTEADGRTPHRLGYGVLDIAAAEQAARNFGKPNPTTEDHVMERFAEFDTDRELVGPGGPAWTGAGHGGSGVRAELVDDYDEGSFEDDLAFHEAYPQPFAATPANRRGGLSPEEIGYADYAPRPAAYAPPLDVSRQIPDRDWVSDASEAYASSRYQHANPYEQAAPDPYCQRRADIARIARAELRAWRGLTEADPGRLASLVRYWSAAGRSAQDAQDTARDSAADRVPWSAAFICFVMRSAGIRRTDGFAFSGAHMRYIVEALRNRERSDQNRPFWLVDSVELVNEVTLQPGDLLCFNRTGRFRGRRVRSNHSYSSLRRDYWEGNNRNVNPVSNANIQNNIIFSHTSVVVGTTERGGRRMVECIGGNEGNTVRLQRYPINASGGIDNPAAHGIFGAIKLIRC